MIGAARVVVAMLVIFSLAGCHKEQPLVAGGKSVGHWIERSHDLNEKVRKEAVAKLGNVGNADPGGLPALIAALKDQNPAGRHPAIVGIVKNGPEASGARGSLGIVQSNNPDPEIRDFAAKEGQKCRPG